MKTISHFVKNNNVLSFPFTDFASIIADSREIQEHLSRLGFLWLIPTT